MHFLRGFIQEYVSTVVRTPTTLTSGLSLSLSLSLSLHPSFLPSFVCSFANFSLFTLTLVRFANGGGGGGGPTGRATERLAVLALACRRLGRCVRVHPPSATGCGRDRCRQTCELKEAATLSSLYVCAARRAIDPDDGGGEVPVERRW